MRTIKMLCIESEMKNQLLIWLGAVLCLVASGYAFMSFIFYSWLNAANPEQWPAKRAALWAYPALAISVALFAGFVYMVYKSIKLANVRKNT